MTTVEAVQRDIAALEKSIRDKEAALAEKRKALGGSQLTFAESERQLADVEARLQQATDELKAAEAEKQNLTPQYERCMAAKDHHLQTAEYKKEISAAESELREADGRIKELEARLKEVSATYKTERERRMLMLTRVRTLVDDLRSAVEHKISLTQPATVDGEELPDARATLQALTELARERELAILSWTRQSRELSAVVDMKRARTLELKLEAEQSLGQMRAQKDQEIREAVERQAAERNALLREIEELKALNEEQLNALKKGKPKYYASSKSDSQQHTPRRGESQISTTEKLLQDRNADLDKEKETLNEQLRETATERQRLLVATKTLRKQLEAEETRHTLGLRNIENQIQNERNHVAQLEKENKKLKEACDALAATLRCEFSE